MKATAWIALAALAMAGGASAATRTVAAQDTSRLDVSGRFTVEVAEGPQGSVVLDGADADIDKIGVRADAGGVRVWQKCSMFCSDRKLRVTVRIVAPDLRAIEAARGVSVHAVDIAAETISLAVSTGAGVEITGRCTTLNASASTGGGLDAEHFICANVTADASMGGAAKVHATQSIHAEARMGGAVSVSGAPPRRNISSSMGGAVETD
jgi:hypothetical protein